MVPTVRDLKEQSVGMQPILKVGQKVHNGQCEVKRCLTPSSFIVWHKDFEQEFILRQIHEEEDLEVWINMVAHSNIVTCVD
jgi:hypothetical protein